MSNPVLQARFGRLFQMYDADHDGYWTLADFTDHVNKLAAMRGQASDSPAHEALRTELTVWWDQIAAGADADHDGRVSRAELYEWTVQLNAVLQQMVDAGAPWGLDPWINTLYNVIDRDGDQRITPDEYRDWLDSTGISRDMDVEAAFRGFDKNTDGFLSRDEFAEVSRQFWLNFDPTVPGHRWIGP